MPTITLTGVSKSYGSGPAAVTDLDLTIPEGSFTCLLGPSGCGKTTTLRMIAGLEHPTAGRIAVGDRVLDSVSDGIFVPPERREMGLVFQNYALWPHLNVAKNVDFGLRVRRIPARQRAETVRRALAMMRIDWAADRYPAELSGGQQQRVSLARMLAVNPEVLLLDEPLSNLDAQLRLEMRAELKRLHAETGHTIVFVTHDQMEAMTMATHVAVMKDGVLQQMEPPMDVYHRPANSFVGEFVGSPPMNMITMESGDEQTAPIREHVAQHHPRHAAATAIVGIRPEVIRLADDRDGLSLPATVTAVLPTGSSWTVSLHACGVDVYLVSYEPVDLEPGSEVTCRVRTGDLHLFDDGGLRLADGVSEPAVEVGR